MGEQAIATADLAGWVDALRTLPDDVTDAERIDRIRLMEDVKGALCAAQAREAAALKRSVVNAEAAHGVPAAKRGRGVAAQVALARRESPHRGDRLMGLAEALVGELPHTMAALACGRISEWRATLVCRETACLTRDERREVDRRMAPDLESMSDRQVAATARWIGYTLDPRSIVNRATRAEQDRRVSIRPAPDTMAIVSAVLPVAEGVAVYAALTKAADAARAAGDERGRGQVMADTLVARVTGREAGQTPVEIQLVMSDKTLLRGGTAPADVVGYGPLPEPVVRSVLARLNPETEIWLRRLYADPDTGELVTMESKRRLFPEPLRRFLLVRDQVCRTPWCGAPVRHADHIVPRQRGGPTSAGNGQGLCERCNQIKESAGWRAGTQPDGTVVTTTPTGHRYASKVPPLLDFVRRLRIEIPGRDAA